MAQPPRLTDRIIDQVDRLGVTTPSLVCEGLPKVTRDQATLALGQLSSNGKLFRHHRLFRHSRRHLVYYTKNKRDFRHREMIQALAGAEYLVRNAPLELCLPPAQQRVLTASPLPEPATRRFSFVPCFLSEDAAAGAMLSLVLAMPHDDLQLVIAELDQCASRTLAGWMLLLTQQMIRFVVLVPKRARADELTRWLRRRPVLGLAAGTLQPVPVSVVQWPMLVG